MLLPRTTGIKIPAPILR